MDGKGRGTDPAAHRGDSRAARGLTAPRPPIGDSSRSASTAGSRRVRSALEAARFSSATSSARLSRRKRPSAISASSTAPRRPSNVVQTGVPSATASRFIVPPAETTRSANAISDCASIARSGTMKPSQLGALLGRAREHDGLLAPQAVEHRGEQRVLEAVVERDGRRRAHDGDRPRRVEPELAEHRLVGLEVREVVLLLEARVAAQLGAAWRRTGARRSGGIASGTTTRLRQPAVDRVLDRRPLVVERGRAGDPQQRGGDGHVVGAVAERDVEPASARPARQRGRAREQADALGGEPAAAVVADRLDARARERSASPSVCAKSRAVTCTSRPLARERPDDRAHDEHVRGVREVDPDPHRVPRRPPRRPARASAPGSSGSPGACAPPRRCPAAPVAARTRASPAAGASARGSRPSAPIPAAFSAAASSSAR